MAGTPPAAGAGSLSGGAPDASAPRGRAARAAMVTAAALLAAGVIAALLPQAPNYDTALHLIWAREIWDGVPPGFELAAASTMHPLWLLLALLLIPFGPGFAIEAMQLITVASLGFVIAGAWLLARRIAGPVAGAIAALSVASSFALLLLAYKAYVDVPFVALVLWAVVLEARPTAAATLSVPISMSGQGNRDAQRDAVRFRGVSGGRWAVPVLLLLAGLLRPEAWAFGLLLVGSRLLRGTTLRQVGGPAAVVLLAPLLWMLTDFAATGDPLHALTGTQSLAEELGRPTGLARAPKELVVLLGDLVRPPIFAAGLAGILLAAWGGRWRRPETGLPLLVLAAACGGFLLVGLLGLPLLQRYLQIAGVLTAVFAGVTVSVLWALARGHDDPRRVPPRPGDPSSGRQRAGAAPPANGVDATAPPWPFGSPALRLAATALLGFGVLASAGYLVLKAGSFRTVARGALQEATWQRQAVELVEQVAGPSQGTGTETTWREGQPAGLVESTCGPITMPTYRLVPELALRSERPMSHGDSGTDQVFGAIASRATTLGGIGPQVDGIAIVIDGDRKARTRLAYAAGVDRATNRPQPGNGWEEVARVGPFVAYRLPCL